VWYVWSGGYLFGANVRELIVGLSDYIVLFELRQRFANVWTEVVSSNQV